MKSLGYYSGMQAVIDEKELRIQVAANIIRLRKAKGLTQDALAEAIGITRIHLSRIENERQTPSATLLFSIADALAVSTDVLRQTSERKKLVRTA